MGKLKILLAAALLALSAKLISCNSNRNPLIIYKDPLFAYYEDGISDNGRFLALKDNRDESKGDILAFDTQTKKLTTILDEQSFNEYNVFAATGNKIVVKETDITVPGRYDFIVCDLENCVKDFDTNTDNAEEYFYGFVNNGQKAIVEKWDTITLKTKIFAYDFATKTLDDLFPTETDSYLLSYYSNFGAKKVIATIDSNNFFKFHSLDIATGNIDLMLDLTGVQANQVFLCSTPEIAVYSKNSNSEIIFQKIGGNAITFNAPDPTNNDYTPYSPSHKHDQAIVVEQNKINPTIKRYFHLNLNTSVVQEIDFSSFSGWEPGGWLNSYTVGENKIMIDGSFGIPGVPELLFYDPQTNTVEDLLTPLTSPLGTISSVGVVERDDKALLLLSIDTGAGLKDKFYLFDGTNLTEEFSTYQSIMWQNHSQNPEDYHRYIALRGITTSNEYHLIMYDLENETSKIVETSTEYLEWKRASRDYTKFSFIKSTFGGDTTLNSYDRITDTVLRDLISDPYHIQVKDFSKDGTKIVYERGLHDKVCVLDMQTKKEILVSYGQ